MDYQSVIQRHMGNLSRQVGHDVRNKYSYIVNQDDLTNAYLQMKNDLGYPLMVDSKYRRAIVYNKEGLEKQITDMINNCIISNIEELESAILEDVGSDIESMLNGLVQGTNGTITIGNGRDRSGGKAIYRFANTMAKAVVKGVGKIIDNIIDFKEDKRR